jgi:membrane protein
VKVSRVGAAAGHLMRETFRHWSADYALSMGAALAYYSFFSMAPLLLLVIAVAGLVFGQAAAQGHLMHELSGLLGQEAAAAIQAVVASVNHPAQSWVAALVSAAVVLVGATSVFAELQDALDRIWRAPPRPHVGVFALLKDRLLSFGMILGLAFLLLVSLVVSALVSALDEWWRVAFGEWLALAQAVNVMVGFGFTTAVFAMIYKFMPRVRVAWRDVWIGAVVTALLFSVGRFFIGLYLGRSGIASTYGAAGSLVIVLVWVYYSAQAFLLGAEFTWVYACTYGSHQGSRAIDQEQEQEQEQAQAQAPAALPVQRPV